MLTIQTFIKEHPILLENFKLFLTLNLSATAFFSLNRPLSVWNFVHISASICLFLIYLYFLFRRRPCGHGSANRWYKIQLPFVIDPCPVCGEKSFGQDATDGNAKSEEKI